MKHYWQEDLYLHVDAHVHVVLVIRVGRLPLTVHPAQCCEGLLIFYMTNAIFSYDNSLTSLNSKEKL